MRLGVNKRPCPRCGGQMDRKSIRCRACADAEHASRGPACPRCAQPTRREAQLCAFCARETLDPERRFETIAFACFVTADSKRPGGQALVFDRLTHSTVYATRWEVRRSGQAEKRLEHEREKARRFARALEHELGQ